MSKVGAMIREHRRACGMTQADLAGSVGVGTPHISKIERGREHPSEGLLGDIADELGVHPDELLIADGIVPRWARDLILSRPDEALPRLLALLPGGTE